MDKLGSFPKGPCTPGEVISPGCHFRDYGPVQLLKPGQTLAGALTVAPVFSGVGTGSPTWATTG